MSLSKLLIKVSGNGEGLLVSADGERINKVKMTIQSGFFPKLSQEHGSSSLKTPTDSGKRSMLYNIK